MIRDKYAAGIRIATQRFPFLFQVAAEDVEQEIALLEHQYESDEVDWPEWSSAVQRALYRLAVNLGYKRPRGAARYEHPEIPFSIIEYDEDEDEFHFSPWQHADTNIWLQETLEFCNLIINDEFEWKLFLAWLHGWSYQEIKHAFSIGRKEMVKLLQSLAAKIREVAGVQECYPLPMPRNAPGIIKRLQEIMADEDFEADWEAALKLHIPLKFAE